MIHCSINIMGHLDRRWADWFDGLTITNLANGTTVLAGHLPDQASLHGTLTKVRDLGLTLISVQCQDAQDMRRQSGAWCERNRATAMRGRIKAASTRHQASSIRAMNSEQTRAHVVGLDDLPRTGNTCRFEGYKHGDAPVSILVDDEAPGSGPRLHRHPLYAEVFVIQEGLATFTVDGETIEVTGGHIVVVPPGTPHRFVNAGADPLRLVAIHLGARIVTEWLEE
jgi:mannose-6-phosphate isomerase-like protein (cupin superfamily)